MATRRIQKVLIANRGEIAVRIMRTCRTLGIATVAVYSEADREAVHVRMADEAIPIGPASSGLSYLSQERVIDAARQVDADAVHPGYGFLSENARFAGACVDAGLIFIGPSASAIKLMGDKTAARALMAEAGVPMAPGTTDAVSDEREAAGIATDIGFPILIKAAAGGGGKGMRIVHSSDDFTRGLRMARSEAESAFGDSRVFIEKYVERPRHIEFQILADAHGETIHLFERECSIQRRHQKVIEEAPSSILDVDLRRRMGAAAVNAAKACGYTNAGTVEFILDGNREFYFMEMNTRLQVEHPVTEWITGIDLVAEQIRLAECAPLGYRQEDVAVSGHAIECRVYAEDPRNDFLPDPGTLIRHRPPSGVGVRVDAGVEEGGRVEMHYDPMISKLSTWGRDRDEAIERMRIALEDYEILGPKTTIPFCRFVMEHDAFRSGDFSTHFVQDHFGPGSLTARDTLMQEAAAVAAIITRSEDERSYAQSNQQNHLTATSNWSRRRELR